MGDHDSLNDDSHFPIHRIGETRGQAGRSGRTEARAMEGLRPDKVGCSSEKVKTAATPFPLVSLPAGR